jgi:DNA-directed RNA polymerase specialized sigma24 family protein|tara:strand:- start:585 stop:1328 length:744 start_codon:yes stop_codon:yes gene_type:complete
MDRPRQQPNKKRGNSLTANRSIKALAALDFVDLVNAVRRSRKKDRINAAYSEIERRMKPKLQQIAFRFNIPGMGHDDIYQEALYALRFKAIKDYDKTRGNDSGPYPFDKFAILCIRRHLATNLKSSYQNKKKVLNQSLSIDQERTDKSTDESLFLSDIISLVKTDILDGLEKKEYYSTLISNLFSKLSDFEKQVFFYYVRKYSYEQIADLINRRNNLKGKNRVNVKSVDNSLSRCKAKGKQIFAKFG